METRQGERQPAALSGFKSKEFGGQGHTQLVLDDTKQPSFEKVVWLVKKGLAPPGKGHGLADVSKLPHGDIRGAGSTPEYVGGKQRLPPVLAWECLLYTKPVTGNSTACCRTERVTARCRKAQVPHRSKKARARSDTVPLYSGEAPGKAGIALSFAHGHGNPGKCNEYFSYDHQGSYGDKHDRSLYATMYAIIKIVQQAQWHKKPAKDEK